MTRLKALTLSGVAVALARTPQAILDNAPDAPGYPPADTLFPFGHGLSYEVRPATRPVR
jgi:beta-glucosidase